MVVDAGCVMLADVCEEGEAERDEEEESEEGIEVEAWMEEDR